MRLLIEAVLIGASFFAGKRYGQNTEAKAIALGLRIESYGRQELVAVIAKLKTFEGEVFTRLRKFL